VTAPPDDDAVVTLVLPLDEAFELEEHLAVYAEVCKTHFTGEAWVAAMRRDRVLARLRAAMRPTDPPPSNVVDLASRRRP
jgi:hypothetical protein